MKTRLAGVAYVFCGIVMIGSSRANAATVDQFYEPEVSTISAPIISLSNWAQTFTVGLSGTLTQVDVLLNRFGLTIPPGSDIIVEIRSTESGIPGETESSILASALIPPESIPVASAETFIAADFSGAGLPLSAGDVFALVLRAPGIDEFSPLDIMWWGNVLDEYEAGSAFRQPISQGSTTWESIDAGVVDFGFRTYMQVIPIPPALWLFGSGLLGLIGVSKRTKRAV